MFVTMSKRENIDNNKVLRDYIYSNIDRINENATVDNIISIVNSDIKTVEDDNPMSVDGRCGEYNGRACGPGSYCSAFSWCGPEHSHKNYYKNHNRVYSNKYDTYNAKGQIENLNLVKDELKKMNDDSIKKLIKEIIKEIWVKNIKETNTNYSDINNAYVKWLINSYWIRDRVKKHNISKQKLSSNKDEFVAFMATNENCNKGDPNDPYGLCVRNLVEGCRTSNDKSEKFYGIKCSEVLN